MESSALNTAHGKIRRAEALAREARFAEAAECHEQVAKLFDEVHSQISSNLMGRPLGSLEDKPMSLVPSFHSRMTLESLALQRDFHKRQSEIVRMKQVQFEEYKSTMETQQRNLLNKLVPRTSCGTENAINATDKYEGGSLKQAIYRTIEEQDSLLNLMSMSDDSIFKHPKDAGTVIEELRTVNNHLRTLVDSLLTQLETKEHEVQILTEKIDVMSAEKEVRNGETHTTRLAPLPPLTPLEMPLFDFNSS